MAETMHGETIGLMTGNKAWATQETSRKGRLPVLILTWREGYRRALARAAEVQSSGELPVLLKLATQDSPGQDTWREIHSQKLLLLSVSSHFAESEPQNDALMKAAYKAALQCKEGFAVANRATPSVRPPTVAQEEQLTELTEDERKELLEAIHFSTLDDGVR